MNVLKRFKRSIEDVRVNCSRFLSKFLRIIIEEDLTDVVDFFLVFPVIVVVVVGAGIVDFGTFCSSPFAIVLDIIYVVLVISANI